MNANGSNSTTLFTSPANVLLWQPIYSPDGSEIVCSTVKRASPQLYSITLTDAATGTQTVQLTQGNPLNAQVVPIGWIQ